jgi:hypothetical protein
MMTALNGWQRMAHPLVYGEDMRFALYLTNLASMHQFYAQSLVMALTAWQKRSPPCPTARVASLLESVV